MAHTAKRTRAPELPSNITQASTTWEENQAESAKHYGNPRRRKTKSRKQLRAEKKNEQKRLRQVHHESKKRKQPESALSTPAPQPREVIQKPLLANGSTKRPPITLLQKALEDEERELRRLEKLAGFKKKGKLPSNFDADLAFLLGYKDDVPAGALHSDPAASSASVEEAGEEDEKEEEEEEEEEKEKEEEAQEEQEEVSNKHEEEEVGAVDGIHDVDSVPNDSEISDNGLPAEDSHSPLPLSSLQSTSAATGKYVPPALRRPQAETTPTSAIQRQVRGQLNRLALPNLESVCRFFLEQMYRQYPRSEVTDALKQCLLNEFEEVNQSLNLKSFALVRAALIAVISGVEGVEVGSAVLEVLVQSFSESRKQGNTKVATAATHLLAHLYNLSVVHCGLVYDMVRSCIAGFSELDIELLLVLLRDSGLQLRGDDPAALKEIIIGIQERVSSVKKEGKKEFDIRITFMLDRIYDLKNNKQKPTDADNALPLAQKFIKNFLSKNGGGGAGQLLRVGLNDLLEASQKGRWWIVGAAWKSTGPSITPDTAAVAADQQLLALAKAQRMNTDLRRTIFCLLVGAEDYMDAFEKLMKLGLKGNQDREIVYVLVHCASHEKRFNPYYVHLANKLCGWDHNYKFTFQYNLWDKFKHMEELPLLEVAHLALLYAQLIGHFSLSLSVLKALNFELLEAKQHIFVRAFFIELLSKFAEDVVFQVFQRICVIKDLLPFRQGLLVFFAQPFDLPSTLTTEQKSVVRRRMKNAQKVLDEANFVF